MSSVASIVACLHHALFASPPHDWPTIPTPRRTSVSANHWRYAQLLFLSLLLGASALHAAGTVTPGGSNVTVTPDTAQSVSATASFFVIPNTTFTLDSSVGGTCPAGSWSGNVYTTGAITTDCSVSFTASASSRFTAPAIAAGSAHTVVLTSGGTVVAWGDNSYGQSTIPDGLSGVTAITAGADHTIALKSDGTLVAWGRNNADQTAIPDGLNGVTAIAAGVAHTVALKSNGTLVAWGNDTYGQTTVPGGLNGVTAIAVGHFHTVALKSDGTLVAWGRNDSGQTTVPGSLSEVTAIAAGFAHTIALKSDGTLVAWGSNDFGQSTIPGSLSGVTAITAGGLHTAALKADGRVAVWGADNAGQTAIPDGLSSVMAIAAGDYHTVTLKSDGTLVAWGRNSSGQTTIPGGLNLTYYRIIPQATNATVSPGIAQWVPSTASFTVTADANHTLDSSVGGTCPAGSWTGSLYTTGAVTTDCNVAFTASPSSRFINPSVAAGFYHTIALKSDGTLVAWGHNSSGQSTIPDGLRNVTAVAAGGDHSVALKTDGRVAAWGNNDLGQTTLPDNLNGVTAIAAGANHTVALKSDETVVAWGANGDGQTTIPDGLSGVTAIAAGSYHTVALKSDGTVVAWGANGYDQTTIPDGLDGVTAIAAGWVHSVALKSDGTLVAWGNDSYGQTTIPGGLNGVTAIAARGWHSVALKSNGTLVAWGYNNFGQTTIPDGLDGVTAIAAGIFHNVALKIDGTLVAWGSNSHGQTTIPSGLNLAYHRVTPQGTNVTISPGVAQSVSSTASFTVIPDTNHTLDSSAGGTCPAGSWTGNLYAIGAVTTDCNVTFTASASSRFTAPAIAAGARHTVGLKSDGTLVAWGYDGSGQTTIPGGMSDITGIAAGYAHTVVLKSDGRLTAWGDDNYGQTTIPGGLSNVTAIAAGFAHTVALKSDGTLVAWGSNSYGQTTIPGDLNGLVAIAAGYFHTVALKSDGTLVAWGRNDFGQTTTPGNLSGVTAIAAGAYHTVALKSDGTLVAWGWNDFGQSTIPDSLSGVTAITAGGVHTAALKADGRVVAWGENNFGQTTIPGGLSGVTAISAGDYHTVALNSDGTLVAWGDDTYGQMTIPYDLNLAYYQVTPTAGTGGSLDDSAAQLVAMGSGASASFTLTADTGYSINGNVGGSCASGSWSGNRYTTGAVTTDCSLEFSFTLNNHSVTTTTAGTGSGTTSGGDNYDYGSAVILTAAPATGSSFAGWSGDAICAASFDMPDAAVNCTATFSLNRYAITITGGSNGSVSADSGAIAACTDVGGICTDYYDYGSSVILRATPSSGYSTSWSGADAASCSGNNCTFSSITGPKAVTAGFRQTVSNPLCASTQDITAPSHSQSETLRAETLLSAGGGVQIGSGLTVIYEAGNSIALGPDFQAAVGSRFTARIAPVSCAAGRQSNTSTQTRMAHATPVVMATEESLPVRYWTAEQLPAGLLEQLNHTGVEPETLGDIQSDAYGEQLIFTSAADLILQDDNGHTDIYRYHSADASLHLLSHSREGRAANGPSDQPRINGRGNWVVFRSDASDLSWRDDDNNVSDIYLYHLSAWTSERISQTERGEETTTPSAHPDLTGERPTIVYDRDTEDGARGIYQHQLLGTTERLDDASCDANHPILSSDGDYLAWLCGEPNSDAACTLQIRHRETGQTSRDACPELDSEYRLRFDEAGQRVLWSTTDGVIEHASGNRLAH